MRLFVTLLLLINFIWVAAQENPNPLPKYMTAEELKMVQSGDYSFPTSLDTRNNTQPPTFAVRAPGEWEELQSIVVTWDAYFPVLAEIVRYAKEEVEVINIVQNEASVRQYLTNNGIDDENLTFIQAPFNTVWVRDYGPNTVYQNEVDSLILIDWIYNRPRPADDVIPELIANHMDVPVYSTTEPPFDLVHTGGNFMSDGWGTGFSSDLVLEENNANSTFGISDHSEGAVDSIMEEFMGIKAYPKMMALPYDGINHIDMHMKLLDEERWLVGEFPEGVSDGPQIEANIQYVLDQYKTNYGTDFKVERIIQPPCGNGQYPPNCQGGFFSAEYRTYTNALFVNKAILVPIYNTEMDEMALQRWRDLMPGYKIHGIDCRQIINAGGAIHCVTKEIGVANPLWIAHKELEDVAAIDNTQDYLIETSIKHRTGIEEATLYYSYDLEEGYNAIPMTNVNDNTWSAEIPNLLEGGDIFYYINAKANSGKEINRPMPAPEGYFHFQVEEVTMTDTEDIDGNTNHFHQIYPNPASQLTAIELSFDEAESIEVLLVNALGQIVETVYRGKTNTGINRYFFDAGQHPQGMYTIQLKLASNQKKQVEKIMIY